VWKNIWPHISCFHGKMCNVKKKPQEQGQSNSIEESDSLSNTNDFDKKQVHEEKKLPQNALQLNRKSLKWI